MSVNVMNTVFWDVPPRSLVDIYRRFGRTYLNFQGTRGCCLQFERLDVHSSTTGSQCVAR
jgi:hypothetical protein